MCASGIGEAELLGEGIDLELFTKEFLLGLEDDYTNDEVADEDPQAIEIKTT